VTFSFGLRKKITSLVALGACLVAGAACVRAQTVCVSQGQFKTFTYKQKPNAPGAATATFKLEHDVLTIEYKNVAASAFLTGVAFDAAPQLALESNSAATATEGWEAGPSSGGGLGNFDFIVHGNGDKLRLAPGASGKAAFTLDFGRPEVCISKTIAHLTGLAGGTSKPVGVLTGEGKINPNVPTYID
jgi:hypothetical protein